MTPTPEIIQSRLDWARQLAKKNRLRKTNAFEKVLNLLASAEKPVTWTQICEAEPIKQQFDPATIFRILEKLERVSIARRMAFRERASYYSLIAPGEKRQCVVCTQCGTISEVDVECSISEIDRQIEEKTGFTNVRHQVVFFGLCPNCVQVQPQAPAV